MKRAIACVLMAGLVGLFGLCGCASLAIPRMPNLRSYQPSDCDPVLSIHIPLKVAAIHEYGIIAHDLKNDNSLFDKLVSTGQIQALGQNGIQIGSGLATAVSAFKDNLSLGSIIASSVLGGLTAITDARSESKDQDRIDVCRAKGTRTQFFKNEDVVYFDTIEEIKDFSFLKDLDRSKRIN